MYYNLVIILRDFSFVSFFSRLISFLVSFRCLGSRLGRNKREVIALLSGGMIGVRCPQSSFGEDGEVKQEK